MRSFRASGKYRQVTREKPAATNFFLAFSSGKGQCWRNQPLTSALMESTNGWVAETQEEGVVHVSMVTLMAGEGQKLWRTVTRISGARLHFSHLAVI